MNRTLPLPALGLVLSPLLLLAGCGKPSAPQAGPTASGEVLPGTVSDAMLDTDRSRAEAPLAPGAANAASKAGASAAAAASAPAADASAGAADPAQPADAPAPAATSAPAPSPKSKPAASPKASVTKPAASKSPAD